jgi:hypothetical protein
MMFLVIFGSLAAAMAVVAQGNLRTADSGLKVSRAMSAAETGLIFAQRRLESEVSRFVIEKGVVDASYAEDLWLGTYDVSADGAVVILPPTGYTTSTPPTGIVEALRDAHLVDNGSHAIVVEPGDTALPEIDTTYGTLRVRPVALAAVTGAPYFRLKYELLSGVAAVRVTSQGVDGDITRTLQMDFSLEKKIEFAILSPNRVMIGKNVRIEGPLGTRYGLVAGELGSANGDPLIMRSDFYDLDAALDTKLDTFFTALATYDADGDGRLRPEHPAEGVGVTTNPTLVDYDGDEYVDDFDLFLEHYDTNSDGMVAYDAGLSGLPVEFSLDDQLGRLIDEAVADRDGDGTLTASDTGLGYRDGVFDVNDLYAKVHGRLAFGVARAPWEVEHGESYQTVVRGPVRTEIEVAPAAFDVGTDEMREITTGMLSDSQTWFDAEANPTFATQAQTQIDAGTGTYEAPGVNGWEDVPFGSTGAYDYYQRPVYRDMTFANVRIPRGTNALFENCTFIGVTYLETEESCEHENWNYAGAVEPVEDPPGSGTYVYQLRFPDLESETGGTPVPDTRIESNNIRFEGCTFLGSVAGDRPAEYTHWRNKVQFTGTTRFYVNPNDPDLLAQPDAAALQTAINSIPFADRDELAKSSILMPGWSVDVGNFSNQVAASPAATPPVKLKGTIVAGILDARGTVDVHGTLLMTFRPTESSGPLFYGGLTDAFNTTIGYFGPSDGDNEGVDPSDAAFSGFGEITLRYDPDAKLPDGIPWPVRVSADPLSYVEGGSM